MKIAIYIDNRKIDTVDCSNLSSGNPGIGGTEYCILLLAQMVKEFRPDIEVTLLAEKNVKLPKIDEVVLVSGLMEIIPAAKKADILVISSRRDGQPLEQEFFDELDRNNIKTVIWGHNFYYSDYCTRIAECNAIKANVFVGKQQYDRYVDHKVINKSTYIFNMYPMGGKKARGENFKNAVTYIGSLVPEKGFQLLAAAWKSVLEQVPNADLNVIGSGKLYYRDAKLGKYGIAEENFENHFMANLTDADGSILPSVHFLGVLGAEKDDIILETSVGVTNPTGRTETFGISALDFESMGVPVVTIGKGGFLDTVIDHKTGILTTDVASAIVELLKDKNKNIAYGKEGIALAKTFVPEIVIQDWIALFEGVVAGEKINYKKPNNFMNTNLKWMRVANHNIKKAFHISGGLSVIGLESLARGVLRRLGH